MPGEECQEAYPSPYLAEEPYFVLVVAEGYDFSVLRGYCANRQVDLHCWTAWSRSNETGVTMPPAAVQPTDQSLAAQSMRVLDLGCGWGEDLVCWGVTASDEITGIDIDEGRLAVAQVRFPNRTYLQSAGERLPFEDESFDRVISALSLPYMNIQKTL